MIKKKKKKEFLILAHLLCEVLSLFSCVTTQKRTGFIVGGQILLNLAENTDLYLLVEEKTAIHYGQTM